MTIASGLVDINTALRYFAALMETIVWDLLPGGSIPSSSSHTLWRMWHNHCFTGSTECILWAGVLEKVVIPLFTSPLIGMAWAAIMKLVFEIFADWPPKGKRSLHVFRCSQLRLWHTATAIMTLRETIESSRWRW